MMLRLMPRLLMANEAAAAYCFSSASIPLKKLNRNVVSKRLCSVAMRSLPASSFMFGRLGCKLHGEIIRKGTC
jgi:hypothetical protein